MENNLTPPSMPYKVYVFAQTYAKWILLLAFLLLFTGWILGLGFVPMDAKQKDGFRVIYAHVPAASLSIAIYAIMAACAFVTIVWQSKTFELLMMAIAPIGATFTFIALATGSIWGKVMWGTWWEWDARMTSELILLFLYLGAIGLYYTFDNHQHAGRVVAILILVGIINLPIIHFSVEWWHTLHQPSTRGFQSVNPLMRPPLYMAFGAYFLLFMGLVLTRFKTLLLSNSIRRNWGIEKLLLLGDKK